MLINSNIVQLDTWTRQWTFEQVLVGSNQFLVLHGDSRLNMNSFL